MKILGKTYGAPQPSWRGLLSTAQIAAVLTYIRSAWTNKAPAVSPDQVAMAVAPVTFSGGTIFVTACGNCHNPNGRETGASPPLDGNAHVTAPDPRQMLEIIVGGVSGPLTVNGRTYNGAMPGWTGRLSNSDVAAVATYIRSAWSNRASGVNEQEVAAAGPAVAGAIGQSIYSQRCAACHGVNGSAAGLAPLAGNVHVVAPDPSPVIATIKRGKRAMPAWAGQLSDADIAAVMTYLRSAWGNKASPVTEGQASSVN